MATRLNRLADAVLTSTHNLCFKQKYEKYQSFLFFVFFFLLSETFQFLEVKFSIYLNRRVFVMIFLEWSVQKVLGRALKPDNLNKSIKHYKTNQVK